MKKCEFLTSNFDVYIVLPKVINKESKTFKNHKNLKTKKSYYFYKKNIDKKSRNKVLLI